MYAKREKKKNVKKSKTPKNNILRKDKYKKKKVMKKAKGFRQSLAWDVQSCGQEKS